MDPGRFAKRAGKFSNAGFGAAAQASTRISMAAVAVYANIIADATAMEPDTMFGLHL
jgi:hypothetical protein